MKKAIVLVLDYLMLYLFHLARLLAVVLPPRFLRLLFELVGTLSWLSRPRARRDLEKKISDGIPGIKNPYEIKKLGRQACSAMVLPICDGILFERHADEILSKMRISGWEKLEKADSLGKGLLVLANHLGAAPMLLHAVMARLGKPYTPIAWKPDKLPVTRYARVMADFGVKLGCDPECPIIYAGPGLDAITPARKRLAEGKRIGMTIDVLGKRVVDFFGRPAALADGIAHFSIDSGAPIVPVALYRDGWGLRMRMIVGDPIYPEPTGDRKRDVMEIMRRAAREAELQILRSPGQWMCWFGLWKWWKTAEEIMSDKNAGSP